MYCSALLLCLFHLGQAMWRWVCANIKKVGGRTAIALLYMRALNSQSWADLGQSLIELKQRGSSPRAPISMGCGFRRYSEFGPTWPQTAQRGWMGALNAFTAEFWTFAQGILEKRTKEWAAFAHSDAFLLRGSRPNNLVERAQLVQKGAEGAFWQ